MKIFKDLLKSITKEINNELGLIFKVDQEEDIEYIENKNQLKLKI